jgi:hypothetical protein
MKNSTDLSSQLVHEVLHNPPSAALPSNLPDRWLDIALQGAERLVQADEEADPELVRIPVSLVLHLLSQELASGALAMSDEKLFMYLGLYRMELAMEKLRRWGVVLEPAADKTTIFHLAKASGRSTAVVKARKKHRR